MIRFMLIVIALCAFELVMPLETAAQQSSPAGAQMTLKQQLVHTEARRRNRIAGNMLLSNQEARGFWLVYQEYRGVVVGVREQQLDIIVEYANAYNRGGIAPDKAQALLTEAMRLEAERQRLKREYLRKAADVLGPTRQLRLYQVETRLDAEAQAGVLAQIPLAQ